MVWQWRVLPIDQQFHFLGCFGGPEPEGNGPRIPKLRVWNGGEQFYQLVINCKKLKLSVTTTTLIIFNEYPRYNA